ncbi:MAG TPA: glutaredoxin domain-containing protein [Candidatus Omnitrophota bacterium]|nr:glutaredoxin domain-containing protein [Candidatus Omnitrophota bacterium]
MAHTVLVYSTATCPYCIRLKQFLAENNIAYENFDVGADRAKADEMVKKSGQLGVPVIEIDGRIIVGFDRPRIKEALGLP